jgi:hypothetical protein
VKTPALETAYRATAYCVDLPAGGVCLRIGEASAALAAALAACGVSEWAILCAANPGSQTLSDAENAQRFGELHDALAALGYDGWLGVNLADAGDWPPEPSVCVPGLGRDEALRLAARFGQNAIVAGDARGVPALLWVG